MCLSETQAKKSQREEDISVSAVQKPLILLMVFVLVLKINAIIQTILRITDNGVSIGTKIKKMVLTHLGSGAISRIPGLNVYYNRKRPKIPIIWLLFHPLCFPYKSKILSRIVFEIL